MTDKPTPPRAPKRPTTLTQHGDERIDNWYWLRERDSQEVMGHLDAENAYTKAQMEPTEAGRQHLFEEIVGRIQETDLSVPVRKGQWRYYQRTEEGRQYAIHCRKQLESESEQILLDANLEAEGADFFDIGAFNVSPDAKRLAYSTDTAGAEVFTMKIRDLDSGTDLADRLERTYYGSAWAKDGSVLFYVRPDDAMRPYQVWRHVVGEPADSDVLILQEDDERFFLGVGNSRTDDYIVIHVGSSLTSEIHLLRSDDPLGTPSVVEPRRQGIEYSLTHHRSSDGDRFFVTTNEDAPNFKLMVTPADTPQREHWSELIEHRDDVKLDGVEAFADFLVLSERAEANARLSIYDLNTGDKRILEQPEEVYTARSSGNAEFDTTTLRYEYTSLITPRTVYEVDLESGSRTVLKQQPVLGGYDSANYVSERLWATASDGAQVPISLVFRKDRPRNGAALLYGYGSYEISMDPGFSSLRLSLLDRGFMFAIAHIRGGGDMGRLWYEHGKFLEKKNTFTDFIACAEYLIDEGYTSASQLAIRGGSAGGLLMGAVTNMRPELFSAVVAEVPFVDVLTTMLDTSLPLTVHEFEEWGNPAETTYYDYIKSYSPYDNVAAKDYPSMLVTAGLNDPRVNYWEPAKWTQQLRDLKTDANDVLLKVEMGAGHMGPSGRYDAWKDEAFVYAFICKTLGVPIDQ